MQLSIKIDKSLTRFDGFKFQYAEWDPASGMPGGLAAENNKILSHEGDASFYFVAQAFQGSHDTQ